MLSTWRRLLSALILVLAAAGCDGSASHRETFAELLKTKQVSDANFQAAKERYGEKGVVDIICLSGWYHIVSMALNVDRYPLAKGQQPELQPLANPIP